MAALGARDAERLLRFVAAAEELAGDDDPSSTEILVELLGVRSRTAAATYFLGALDVGTRERA